MRGLSISSHDTLPPADAQPPASKGPNPSQSGGGAHVWLALPACSGAASERLQRAASETSPA